VTVTSLASVALKVGANRVVRGTRFSHPCGHPGLTSADERAWRVELVRTAVAALRTDVAHPTVFEPPAAVR
jgi:glycine/betaine/sarcosine/D-proline reductase family selenoprotein B